MRIFVGFLMLVSLIGCAVAPVNRVSKTPLTTVASVDLDRYQGRWYEIARLPNRFERDCEGVTADYARRPDGLISVINTCRKGGLDGPVDQAKGRARIVDTQTNSKLKVSFFGPFWGDYWILDLADDYSLAIVGEPKGRLLWILARSPSIEDEVLSGAISKLDQWGYNTDALYFPAQAEPASQTP